MATEYPKQNPYADLQVRNNGAILEVDTGMALLRMRDQVAPNSTIDLSTYTSKPGAVQRFLKPGLKANFMGSPDSEWIVEGSKHDSRIRYYDKGVYYSNGQEFQRRQVGPYIHSKGAIGRMKDGRDIMVHAGANMTEHAYRGQINVAFTTKDQSWTKEYRQIQDLIQGRRAMPADSYKHFIVSGTFEDRKAHPDARGNYPTTARGSYEPLMKILGKANEISVMSASFTDGPWITDLKKMAASGKRVKLYLETKNDVAAQVKFMAAAGIEIYEPTADPGKPGYIETHTNMYLAGKTLVKGSARMSKTQLGRQLETLAIIRPEDIKGADEFFKAIARRKYKRVQAQGELTPYGGVLDVVAPMRDDRGTQYLIDPAVSAASKYVAWRDTGHGLENKTVLGQQLWLTLQEELGRDDKMPDSVKRFDRSTGLLTWGQDTGPMWSIWHWVGPQRANRGPVDTVLMNLAHTVDETLYPQNNVPGKKPYTPTTELVGTTWDLTSNMMSNVAFYYLVGKPRMYFWAETRKGMLEWAYRIQKDSQGGWAKAFSTFYLESGAGAHNFSANLVEDVLGRPMEFLGLGDLNRDVVNELRNGSGTLAQKMASIYDIADQYAQKTPWLRPFSTAGIGGVFNAFGKDYMVDVWVGLNAKQGGATAILDRTKRAWDSAIGVNTTERSMIQGVKPGRYGRTAVALAALGLFGNQIAGDLSSAARGSVFEQFAFERDINKLIETQGLRKPIRVWNRPGLPEWADKFGPLGHIAGGLWYLGVEKPLAFIRNWYEDYKINTWYDQKKTHFYEIFVGKWGEAKDRPRQEVASDGLHVMAAMQFAARAADPRQREAFKKIDQLGLFQEAQRLRKTDPMLANKLLINAHLNGMTPGMQEAGARDIESSALQLNTFSFVMTPTLALTRLGNVYSLSFTIQGPVQTEIGFTLRLPVGLEVVETYDPTKDPKEVKKSYQLAYIPNTGFEAALQVGMYGMTGKAINELFLRNVNNRLMDAVRLAYNLVMTPARIPGWALGGLGKSMVSWADQRTFSRGLIQSGLVHGANTWVGKILADVPGIGDWEPIAQSGMERKNLIETMMRDRPITLYAGTQQEIVVDNLAAAKQFYEKHKAFTWFNFTGFGLTSDKNIRAERGLARVYYHTEVPLSTKVVERFAAAKKVEFWGLAAFSALGVAQNVGLALWGSFREDQARSAAKWLNSAWLNVPLIGPFMANFLNYQYDDTHPVLKRWVEQYGPELGDPAKGGNSPLNFFGFWSKELKRLQRVFGGGYFGTGTRFKGTSSIGFAWDRIDQDELALRTMFVQYPLYGAITYSHAKGVVASKTDARMQDAMRAAAGRMIADPFASVEQVFDEISKPLARGAMWHPQSGRFSMGYAASLAMRQREDLGGWLITSNNGYKMWNQFFYRPYSRGFNLPTAGYAVRPFKIGVSKGEPYEYTKVTRLLSALRSDQLSPEPYQIDMDMDDLPSSGGAFDKGRGVHMASEVAMNVLKDPMLVVGGTISTGLAVLTGAYAWYKKHEHGVGWKELVQRAANADKSGYTMPKLLTFGVQNLRNGAYRIHEGSQGYNRAQYYVMAYGENFYTYGAVDVHITEPFAYNLMNRNGRIMAKRFVNVNRALDKIVGSNQTGATMLTKVVSHQNQGMEVQHLLKAMSSTTDQYQALTDSLQRLTSGAGQSAQELRNLINQQGFGATVVQQARLNAYEQTERGANLLLDEILGNTERGDKLVKAVQGITQLQQEFEQFTQSQLSGLHGAARKDAIVQWLDETVGNQQRRVLLENYGHTVRGTVLNYAGDFDLHGQSWSLPRLFGFVKYDTRNQRYFESTGVVATSLLDSIRESLGGLIDPNSPEGRQILNEMKATDMSEEIIRFFDPLGGTNAEDLRETVQDLVQKGVRVQGMSMEQLMHHIEDDLTHEARKNYMKASKKETNAMLKRLHMQDTRLAQIRREVEVIGSPVAKGAGLLATFGLKAFASGWMFQPATPFVAYSIAADNRYSESYRRSAYKTFQEEKSQLWKYVPLAIGMAAAAWASLPFWAVLGVGIGAELLWSGLAQPWFDKRGKERADREKLYNRRLPGKDLGWLVGWTSRGIQAVTDWTIGQPYKFLTRPGATPIEQTLGAGVGIFKGFFESINRGLRSSQFYQPETIGTSLSLRENVQLGMSPLWWGNLYDLTATKVQAQDSAMKGQPENVLRMFVSGDLFGVTPGGRTTIMSSMAPSASVWKEFGSPNILGSEAVQLVLQQRSLETQPLLYALRNRYRARKEQVFAADHPVEFSGYDPGLRPDVIRKARTFKIEREAGWVHGRQLRREKLVLAPVATPVQHQTEQHIQATPPLPKRPLSVAHLMPAPIQAKSTAGQHHLRELVKAASPMPTPVVTPRPAVKPVPVHKVTPNPEQVLNRIALAQGLMTTNPVVIGVAALGTGTVLGIGVLARQTRQKPEPVRVQNLTPVVLPTPSQAPVRPTAVPTLSPGPSPSATPQPQPSQILTPVDLRRRVGVDLATLNPVYRMPATPSASASIRTVALPKPNASKPKSFDLKSAYWANFVAMDAPYDLSDNLKTFDKSVVATGWGQFPTFLKQVKDQVGDRQVVLSLQAHGGAHGLGIGDEKRKNREYATFSWLSAQLKQQGFRNDQVKIVMDSCNADLAMSQTGRGMNSVEKTSWVQCWAKNSWTAKIFDAPGSTEFEMFGRSTQTFGTSAFKQLITGKHEIQAGAKKLEITKLAWKVKPKEEHLEYKDFQTYVRAFSKSDVDERFAELLIQHRAIQLAQNQPVKKQPAPWLQALLGGARAHAAEPGDLTPEQLEELRQRGQKQFFGKFQGDEKVGIYADGSASQKKSGWWTDMLTWWNGMANAVQAGVTTARSILVSGGQKLYGTLRRLLPGRENAFVEAGLARLGTNFIPAEIWDQGCAASVSRVLQDAGAGIKGSASVQVLQAQLKKKGWTSVPLDQRQGGDVVVYRKGSFYSHVAISDTDPNKVLHYSSSTKVFRQEDLINTLSGSHGGDTLEILRAPALKRETGTVETYRQLVWKAAQRAHLGTDFQRLAVAVMTHESGGNPNAISPAGAVGLMQLMPVHWKRSGKDPFDPVYNVTLGVGILAKSFKAGKGNVDDSLRIYNAGYKGWLRGAGGAENRNYPGKVLAEYNSLQDWFRAQETGQPSKRQAEAKSASKQQLTQVFTETVTDTQTASIAVKPSQLPAKVAKKKKKTVVVGAAPAKSPEEGVCLDKGRKPKNRNAVQVAWDGKGVSVKAQYADGTEFRSLWDPGIGASTFEQGLLRR